MTELAVAARLRCCGFRCGWNLVLSFCLAEAAAERREAEVEASRQAAATEARAAPAGRRDAPPPQAGAALGPATTPARVPNIARTVAQTGYRWLIWSEGPNPSAKP